MAYSEIINEEGLITRKYFGQDPSGIFKMYYNKKLIKFPNRMVRMGTGNEVILKIDMRNFVKNFILIKAVIKVTCSHSYIKNKLNVYQCKSLYSTETKELGYMEKDKGCTFKFDITDLLVNHLNSALYLGIKTSSVVDLYSLFAFYKEKAELVIEYYDDSFIDKNSLVLFDKQHKISINTLNGIAVLEKDLLKIGDIDLKLVFNNHFKDRSFQFNYNQFICGGIDNFKYIDSLGIKHYFKLIGNDFIKHQDLFNKNTKLESGSYYKVINNDEVLTFNDRGYLISLNRNNCQSFITYDMANQIESIKDSYGNEIYFKYVKNKILILNNKNKKTIKIVLKEDSLSINKSKYYVDKNGNLFNTKNLILKYDSVNRIKEINLLNVKYKINYRRKKEYKND